MAHEMKSSRPNLAAIIPGFMALFALIAMLVWIAGATWKAYAALDATVATALATAAATVLVAVLSVLLAKYYERRQIFEREMLGKKFMYTKNCLN